MFIYSFTSLVEKIEINSSFHVRKSNEACSKILSCRLIFHIFFDLIYVVVCKEY